MQLRLVYPLAVSLLQQDFIVPRWVGSGRLWAIWLEQRRHWRWRGWSNAMERLEQAHTAAGLWQHACCS
jgi:hypothetical protein